MLTVNSIARILLISLSAFFAGAAVFFGLVSGWTTLLASPLLALFGWFYFIPLLVFVAFSWKAYNPQGTKVAYRTLFIVISIVLGSSAMYIMGLPNAQWTTKFVVSGGVSGAIVGWLVMRMKRGT